jgi:hypothetical protein
MIRLLKIIEYPYLAWNIRSIFESTMSHEARLQDSWIGDNVI